MNQIQHSLRSILKTLEKQKTYHFHLQAKFRTYGVWEEGGGFKPVKKCPKYVTVIICV